MKAKQRVIHENLVVRKQGEIYLYERRAEPITTLQKLHWG